MTSQRRQQVEKVFENAASLPPNRRGAFLDEACAGDAELRREVESLLSRNVAPAQEANLSPPTRDFAGQQIQSYRVLERIGGGGMGIVYLAEDTRLGRQVALKTLPLSAVADQGRLRRFLREARAASAISHPNVITVFEVGEVDGAPFIVSEFVEGENLNSKIAGKPLPSQEIIQIASQIAEALETAHASGIIHRDIKPANIMLTKQGQVKVLDFGLAIVSPDSPAVRTVDLQTDLGLVMGTVQYMSPEQALAREVDSRTDIFSLGLVMYEMATGVLPFQGQNIVETLDRVIHQEPETVSTLNPKIPADLERIIRKCMEKEKERRYQTARELNVDLKNLKRDTESGRISPAKMHKARYPWLWKAALALGVLAIAGGGIIFRFGILKTESVSSPPKMSFVQLTVQPGQETFPTLSPDGKFFVYAASGDIFWQRVGGKTWLNLTADSSATDTEPAFSPDGEHIAFRSERDGGGIFTMEATGENVRRITDFGFNPCWSPDATEILVATENINEGGSRNGANSGIWAIQVDSLKKRRIEAGSDAVQPSWSPHQSRIAYWSLSQGRRDLWTVPASGGSPVQLTHDSFVNWNPVWSPDGRFLYFAGDRSGSMNLWRIPINEDTGAALGPPEPVTTPSVYSRNISFSRDGRRIAYTQVQQSEDILRIGFDLVKETVMGEPEPILQRSKAAITPEISPDGEWIAFWSGLIGVDHEDIWVVRKDGAGLRQLTNDAYMDRVPRWSPDGKLLAFYSNRTGNYEIWTIQPDGTNMKQITFLGAPISSYPAWSPDAKRLSFIVSGKATYLMDLTKPWNRDALIQLPNLENPPRRFSGWSWSHDGEKLAGWLEDNEGRNAGLAIYSIRTGDYKTLDIPTLNLFWLRDNKRLLSIYGGDLSLIDTVSGRKKVLVSDPQKHMTACSTPFDERTICYGVESIESDVWMIQLQ